MAYWYSQEFQAEAVLSGNIWAGTHKGEVYLFLFDKRVDLGIGPALEEDDPAAYLVSDYVKYFVVVSLVASGDIIAATATRRTGRLSYGALGRVLFFRTRPERPGC